MSHMIDMYYSFKIKMNSYIGIFFCLIAILILQKIETSNQFHEKNGSDHLLGCREQDMSIFVNGIL